MQVVSVLLATTLATHPFDLYRVDEPDYPGADAYSATGAVVLSEPPEGVPWRFESVPHADGWVAQEALGALNADVWHSYGITGAGIDVAIFDLHWFGSEVDAEQTGGALTWDCYSHVTCEVPMDTFSPRFQWEEGVHGFACAEVVHDVAPDASVHLVRVNGVTTIENAVDWAIRNEIDIISMSMSFFNSSFYDGSGPLAALVEKLAAHEILMVTSAGNSAQQHWAGPWVDRDLDGRLDFDGDNGLEVSLNAGKNRGVYVSWNEHHFCGPSDLDAVLLDGAGNIVGRSDGVQDVDETNCSPVERLTGYVEEAGTYWLEVSASRVVDVALDVDVFVTSGSIVGAVAEGSLADPAPHPSVMAVGAVKAVGYIDNDIEVFSSRGPTVAGIPKPDIAGPDGLTTSAYGARGFFGTSAAAPVVAGAVALIMSDDAGLSSYDAAKRLQEYALSENVLFAQPDSRWGAGKARLPVESEGFSPCGQRPLVMLIWWVPLGVWRRRWWE